VLDTCKRLGIGFVAFSPLGRGMLAGSIQDDRYAPGDIRLGMPRFVGDRLVRNLEIVAGFRDLAASAGCTPAQLALAWLLARGAGVVAIPGTRSIAHLDENLATSDVHIAPDILAAADRLLAPNTLTGARYSQTAQRDIDPEFLPGEERAG
jgi:aryl-alcohol dehydrogenase-like predicted oxidoreductase